jgi:hypothetical protein
VKTTAGAVILGLVLAACGTPAASNPSTGSQLQAEVVATELVVGPPQRVPIGILDHNTPVSDATVHVRSFTLKDNTGTYKGESDAPFKGEGLQGAGTYVAHLTFDAVADWGIEVSASRPNGQHAVLRLSLPQVAASPTVPGLGQPALASHNLRAKDVPDLSYIDSGTPPDDMHQLSIADAIAKHQPALVVFASPALCVSRVCGPQVQAVQTLEPSYRDRLAFIHVEPYQLKPIPSREKINPVVTEWRLQSEPWIFLIDGKGIIRARFEGPTATDEVKTAIDQLLASA